MRKESSEGFFYVCASFDRSTYLVPGVADHPVQDESVHLTVVAISGHIAGCMATTFKPYKISLAVSYYLTVQVRLLSRRSVGVSAGYFYWRKCSGKIRRRHYAAHDSLRYAIRGAAFVEGYFKWIPAVEVGFPFPGKLKVDLGHLLLLWVSYSFGTPLLLLWDSSLTPLGL